MEENRNASYKLSALIAPYLYSNFIKEILKINKIFGINNILYYCFFIYIILSAYLCVHSKGCGIVE